LWVPEVGGSIDPRYEAHDPVMSLFGGMSKGERNRIKIRFKATMCAPANDEGRFLATSGSLPCRIRIASGTAG